MLTLLSEAPAQSRNQASVAPSQQALCLQHRECHVKKVGVRQELRVEDKKRTRRKAGKGQNGAHL